MTYVEKLNVLREEAIADLIKIHELLVMNNGEPPMVIFKNDPLHKTNFYEISVREYKTFWKDYTFKLSAIGIHNANGLESYYIRGYSTLMGYRRLKLQEVETGMLIEFTDHLKKIYN